MVEKNTFIPILNASLVAHAFKNAIVFNPVDEIKSFLGEFFNSSFLKKSELPVFPGFVDVETQVEIAGFKE